MKIFKSWRPEQEEPFFVFFIFSSAFVYSSIYIIVKKIKIVKQTALWGLALGVPNVFSTIFLTRCTIISSSNFSLSTNECWNNNFYNPACIFYLERKIKPLGNFSSRKRYIGNFIFESWQVIYR